jgi:N-carbamoyl-L-amino-acid hydrolase
MKRRSFVRAAASAAAVSAAGGAVPATSSAQARSLRVNGARINAHLKALSEFGKNPQGGVSRVAYSDADRAGREYVMGLMRDAKLDVSIDAAGNIWGRRPGSDARLKPIVFGSHIDSVPEGGNYDGDVGTLGAIEVAQTLAEAATTTRHALEVVCWQNEEGGLYGSHGATGILTAQELAEVSVSGKTIRDGIAFIGGRVDQIESARRSSGDVAGYFELHIEQGGTLEREKVDIGVVEGIVGIMRFDVIVDGFANHAGTTAMADRRDALLASARFIDAVNGVVTSTPGRQVATVGKIQAFPGATNVIPGRAEFTLEIRDLDDAKVASLADQLRKESDRIGKMNGTAFTFRPASTVHKSALSDPAMRAFVADSAKALGLSSKLMPSGAGHDAQNMARIGPMGMIFIPSIGGISHSPKEFSTPRDIENGVNVLLHAVMAADAAMK